MLYVPHIGPGIMEQDHPHGPVALIVGITGMVGISLAEALKSPASHGGPWQVYGGARRPLPPWFPPSTIDQFIAFDATDYNDTIQKLSPLSPKITHLFWVAIHVATTEEANTAINTAMLDNVLTALVKSSRDSALRHVCVQTGTKHYMGPILGTEGINYIPETPFEEESPRLSFPNFYYDLEDLVASYSSAFKYSIHRASIIMGASSRTVYNALLSLSVYALICKHEGLPFRYPGSRYTWEHFCDMSDARLLAEQQIWAATMEEGGAKNEAFNCTNGDVFTWKRVWKELCEIFELEFVPFDETQQFNLVEEMKSKDKVWDLIVEEHGLYKTKFGEITSSFHALTVVLNFKFQHVSSMNKSREFGFFKHVDTIKSLRMWVDRLRKMKIIS